MKLAIRTKDRYLYQKLFLELTEAAGFELTSEEERADLVICDADTERAREGELTLSRRAESGADILLPARLGAVAAMIAERGEERLRLDAAAREVHLGGRCERLTELEFALLSLLVERRGFVSREEILDRLWTTETNDGIINVYIHYLREKLERDGSRIILSSRREGYRISESFLPREKGERTNEG